MVGGYPPERVFNRDRTLGVALGEKMVVKRRMRFVGDADFNGGCIFNQKNVKQASKKERIGLEMVFNV